MHRPLQIISSAFIITLFFTLTASAQIVTEGLCDSQFASQMVGGVQVPDCRWPLIVNDPTNHLVGLIAGETQGIDVAFWYMEDSRYSSALIAAHRARPSMPIRVLVDERANNTEAHGANNAQILTDLKNAGIQMREKIPDTSFNIQILHNKMMLFHGQNVVEFSKANYEPSAFVPDSNGFIDEAIFYTNDDRLTNSFRRRFDDMWTNTSAFQNYANITGSLLRNYPTYAIDPAMNFPGENNQSQNFFTRLINRVNAETSAIDAMVYRVTDHDPPDAIISAINRGVTVRLITDPGEYRNPGRLWDAAHIDRMYMAGAKVRIGTPGRYVHESLVILRGLGEVIFGSSNWTTPSAYKQDEHNFFYTPAFGKPWFFQWFDDQFTRKWADNTYYVNFTPLPPDTPAYASPTNGTTGATTASITLKWEGGPWAHFYDIYFGTTSTPPLLVSNQQIGSPDPGNQEKYTISNLQPGTTYYWRIVSRTWAQKTKTGPTWSFTTAGSSGGGGGGSTPFNGTPAAIPGTFQAENFDNGGQGVSWNDTTPGNTGGACARSTATDVDMETTTDTGGGCDVGWTRPGEWLNYTVNIATTGTYTFSARVANTGTGGNFHVLVDGVDKAAISVPNTGGWQAWQTVTQTGVSLTSGQHVVRMVFSTASSNGGVGNYNWFRFDSSSSPPPGNTPFNGTPAAIPGTVQAENFDNGGQNVAWFDTTSGNAYGACRPTTDVDVETTTDTGGGCNVAKTKAGEWIEYTVNVAATGTYTLNTRIANMGTGGKFRVDVDGTTGTPIAVPDTGGWQTWQTVTTSGLSLSAGQHVLRLFFVSAGTGGGAGNYNWFQLTSP
jgi:hypothetical protein